MKGIYIFLADGFEDVEALGTNDVLRRAGLRSTLVGIGEDPFAQSSHGVMVGVDENLPFMDIDHSGTTEGDVLIFPGGMVAAICAAPGLVLSQLKGISGATVTCFDGFESYLEKAGARFEPRPAICSGRIITGRSAGHALSFGLEIVGKVCPEKVEQVRHALYLETI